MGAKPDFSAKLSKFTSLIIRTQTFKFILKLESADSGTDDIGDSRSIFHRAKE